MSVLLSSKNISTARILHDVCPKNIFLRSLGGATALLALPPSPTPMSSRSGEACLQTAILRLLLPLPVTYWMDMVGAVVERCRRRSSLIRYFWTWRRRVAAARPTCRRPPTSPLTSAAWRRSTTPPASATCCRPTRRRPTGGGRHPPAPFTGRRTTTCGPRSTASAAATSEDRPSGTLPPPSTTTSSSTVVSVGRRTTTTCRRPVTGGRRSRLRPRPASARLLELPPRPSLGRTSMKCRSSSHSSGRVRVRWNNVRTYRTRTCVRTYVSNKKCSCMLELWSLYYSHDVAASR